MEAALESALRTQQKLIFYIYWFAHTYWFLHFSINMLTSFFEGPPLGNFCLKTSPLSRNSSLVERKRPGREGVL